MVGEMEKKDNAEKSNRKVMNIANVEKNGQEKRQCQPPMLGWMRDTSLDRSRNLICGSRSMFIEQGYGTSAIASCRRWSLTITCDNGHCTPINVRKRCFCLAVLCISSVGAMRAWCLYFLQPKLDSILYGVFGRLFYLLIQANLVGLGIML